MKEHLSYFLKMFISKHSVVILMIYALWNLRFLRAKNREAIEKTAKQYIYLKSLLISIIRYIYVFLIILLSHCMVIEKIYTLMMTFFIA